jgi:biopolymer transport protein TolQ
MNIPVLEMILRSGWVARSIIGMLLLFSIVSWALVFNRWYYYSSITRLNKAFRKRFADLKAITEVDRIDAKESKCPFGELGKLGLAEYKRILTDARADSSVKDWSFYLQSQFAMASERVESAIGSLSDQVSTGLVILAVTSSTTPFLGLLGTVWGIMDAFFEIGNQGSASLPVVAPGIAEALITTVGGLIVAIPALFFYNIFASRAERIGNDMDSFGEEMLLRLKREILSLLFRGKHEGSVSAKQEKE